MTTFPMLFRSRNVLLIFLILVFLQWDQAYPKKGLDVEGRFLFDPNGEKIVLWGVNEMFIWSNDPVVNYKSISILFCESVKIMKLAG